MENQGENRLTIACRLFNFFNLHVFRAIHVGKTDCIGYHIKL